jgi:hypothetical protein
MGALAPPAHAAEAERFLNVHFSDTEGNRLLSDVDGGYNRMIEVVAPKSTVRSTNPGLVVSIVEVRNYADTTFWTITVKNSLQDWEVFPQWSGKSTGNVAICFYDASVFPLPGDQFPLSPNWSFLCQGGGIDITNLVSFVGTGQTVVSVTIDASVLSPLGGFGPGDRITVSTKMRFTLKGSQLPPAYFSDGPNSAGVLFKRFVNSAEVTVDGSSVSYSRVLRGYPKG